MREVTACLPFLKKVIFCLSRSFQVKFSYYIKCICPWCNQNTVMGQAKPGNPTTPVEIKLLFIWPPDGQFRSSSPHRRRDGSIGPGCFDLNISLLDRSRSARVRFVVAEVLSTVCRLVIAFISRLITINFVIYDGSCARFAPFCNASPPGRWAHQSSIAVHSYLAFFPNHVSFLLFLRCYFLVY